MRAQEYCYDIYTFILMVANRLATVIFGICTWNLLRTASVVSVMGMNSINETSCVCFNERNGNTHNVRQELNTIKSSRLVVLV